MNKQNLSEPEKIAKIAEMPLGELQMRRKLINFALRTCQEAGDPQGQISNYKAQLKRVMDAIKAKKGRTGDMDPVTVNAKTGDLAGKSKL